ncbi:tetratricopeptide repeat protein [Sphingomonas sp. GCM10030256]|uniref:tetratricopeptide repeat protein n=1 Tax=Sphingomonas sp. GCM10030256 TaxID=3273427 RepID=UPI00360F6435
MIFTLLAAAALAQAPAPCASGTDGAVCRAFQARDAGKHDAAAQEFEALASASQGAARDRALAAAGNLWIAADQPGKAALALDKALAGAGLQAEQRGEALLDRARAAEAQNDLKTARAKVTEAQASISDDPFLWYFSAALAIREGDAVTARNAIGRALTLAPNEALILFEAGHVAHFIGDLKAARDYWTRAAAREPNSPTGKAAREALALLDKPAAPK